jgi:hypothetical protein
MCRVTNGVFSGDEREEKREENVEGEKREQERERRGRGKAQPAGLSCPSCRHTLSAAAGVPELGLIHNDTKRFQTVVKLAILDPPAVPQPCRRSGDAKDASSKNDLEPNPLAQAISPCNYQTIDC